MELHNQKTNNGRGAEDGPLITLRKVGKSYATPAGPYPALRDIDLEIGAGEFVALVGKSGSGKSTLLNLIGGIDRPSQARRSWQALRRIKFLKTLWRAGEARPLAWSSSSFSCCPL
jgi:ABC-type glutathione transport system ATPase component